MSNKQTNIFFIVFFVFLCSLIFIKRTNSYLTDTEKVLGNSIQVGTWGETSVTPTPTLPPNNLADHLVISEVQTKGNGTNNEFIELYNPTNSVIDISGWSIQDRGANANGYDKKNIGIGNSVPAHGFFLIGHNGNSLPTTPDLTYSMNLTLGGGTVFLVNNQTELDETTDSGSRVVDKVAYGSGTHLRPEGNAYATAPDANQSIERKAYSTSDNTSMMSGADVTKGNAYDSENNADDFILRTTSQPQNTSSTPEIP